MSDFGVNELHIRGSSGTPQLQSVDNLFLRVASNKTVVIGDSDSDFNSPAPEAVDSANTTVLNVGIVTANAYYGTFKGTIQTDGSGGSPSPDGFIINEGEYIDWQASDGTSRVRITGDSSDNFILENDNNHQERLRIITTGEVGINQNNPGNGQMLAIKGRGGYDDIVQVTASGTGENPDVGARINLTNAGVGTARINATNNDLELQTLGVGRLRITSSGDVGIGTINPTDEDALTGNTKVLAVGVVTANYFYGAFDGTVTQSTKIYLTESDDSDAFHNIPYLLDSNTYPTKQGDQYQQLCVDTGGIMFNANNNQIKINRLRSQYMHEFDGNSKGTNGQVLTSMGEVGSSDNGWTWRGGTDTKTASYTLTASDVSKTIIMDGNYNFTIDDDIFSAGDTFTLVNSNSVSIYITQGSSVYLYLAGTSTNGNRTIPPYSLATVLCYDDGSTTTIARFIVSGGGVT